MARFDIMPFISPLGGTFEVRYYPISASQTFDVGEPVAVVDAGTVTGAPADGTAFVLADTDTVGNICGIAAYGPGQASAAAFPSARINLNYRTGLAFAIGDLVGMWPADQGNLFITDNFSAAAAGAVVVPAGSIVGEIYQIVYNNTGTPDIGWGVEQDAGVPGTDVCFVVHHVLNSRKIPIAYNDTTTGVYVVGEIKTK